MNSLYLFSFLFFGLFQSNDESIIKQKLREYDNAVKNKNTQFIANLYTDDALYGDRVKGKKAIKEYLDTYNNVNVVVHQSTTLKLNIQDKIANHEGSYKQVVNSKNKLVEHTGTFRMIWTKQNNEWLISSMRVLTKKTR